MSSSPIRFTPKAKAELQKLQRTLGIQPDQGLRIGTKGGGCGGMAYLLAFDSKEEKDQEYEIEGIRVLVNKAQAMYVIGLEIDYEETEVSRGFVFKEKSTGEKS